jgi:mRNA-capping enzyme
LNNGTSSFAQPQQQQQNNGNENGISREQAMALGLPKRWLYCPKFGNVIQDLFLPLKTPLSEGYDDLLETQYRFHPQAIFKANLVGAKEGAKVKLWINLANTERYYGRNAITSNGCEYLHMPLRGHNETPSVEETDRFIRTVKDFKRLNPNDIIAVHCTHGFNRTGFLIASYLINQMGWDVEAAVLEFANARPNGIYKEDYLQELCKRFDLYYDPNAELPLEAPGRPAWEEGPDPSINYDAMMATVPAGFADNSDRLPQFMDGKVPHVTFVDDPETRSYLQEKVRMLLQPFAPKALKNEFPGSQPVSMDKQNISLLASRPYMVSWKADGMRYLVLINGEDEIYAFDRDNNVFQLPLKFPRKGHLDQHVSDTLVDVEVIMQALPGGGHRPRMLIFDLVIHEKNEVGKKDFKIRMHAIKDLLINPRNEAATKGLLDKTKEPMSVARKDFWDISATFKLFGPAFRNSLGHHVDGLIFQPSDPYTPGRFNLLMKWKPPEESSIDFKLKIEKYQRPAEPVRHVGELYVLGLPKPFAEMKATKTLQQYDGRIIECHFKDNSWHFMRERTDKSHPNAYSTAKSVMETIRNPLTEHYLIDYITHNTYVEGAERNYQQQQTPSVRQQYTGMPASQLQSRVH